MLISLVGDLYSRSFIVLILIIEGLWMISMFYSTRLKRDISELDLGIYLLIVTDG